MFSYKGYVGEVEIDEDENLLYGNVINTRDIITFQGKSVEEAKQAFHDSVDEYLKFCEENGKEPDRPFSGQFMTRIPPDLHRAASAQAAAEKVSLNAWVEALVRSGVEKGSKRRPAAKKAAGHQKRSQKLPKKVSKD